MRQNFLVVALVHLFEKFWQKSRDCLEMISALTYHNTAACVAASRRSARTPVFPVASAPGSPRTYTCPARCKTDPTDTWVGQPGPWNTTVCVHITVIKLASGVTCSVLRLFLSCRKSLKQTSCLLQDQNLQGRKKLPRISEKVTIKFSMPFNPPKVRPCSEFEVRTCPAKKDACSIQLARGWAGGAFCSCSDLRLQEGIFAVHKSHHFPERALKTTQKKGLSAALFPHFH